ncbi:MAG: alpha/beta fold hydrolase [Actinomycetota bacterium]
MVALQEVEEPGGRASLQRERLVGAHLGLGDHDHTAVLGGRLGINRDVALAAAMVASDDGSVTTLTPGPAIEALYGECPEPEVDAALSRLGPQPMATMTQPTSGSPLGSIPSTYVVCLRDRTVHPDHQAAMAARCDRTVVLDTDHSPFLSATTELADIVEPIARGSA